MTRRRKPINFVYNMGGTPLSEIKTIKDLGVDISSKLDWNCHVNRVVKKCNQKLGMIMRTVGFNAPERVTKTLYSSLIRSDLEYGSCLWSGTSKHNVQLLEGVQRRATKFIMHYPDQDYKARLTSLNILPLSLRRDKIDLLFFFRCKSGHYDLDINKFVEFRGVHNRQDHPTTRSSSDLFRLKSHFCRTEAHKVTHFNRIVSLWNQLPSETRQAVNFGTFKSQVADFLDSTFDSTFDPLNVCTWGLVCTCSNCRLI